MAILKSFSRSKDIRAVVDGITQPVSAFLKAAPLEESTLILDGPGLGCSTQVCLLALIGQERLKRLRAVHCVSASGYTYFFLMALAEGALLWPNESLNRWNKDNQQRHGIVPIWSLLSLLASKLIGRRYIFSSDRLEEALTLTVNESFATRKVADFPSNVHFWTFNKLNREFVAINANGPLQELTPGKVMRALTSVPGVYEPFHYKGETYCDVILEKGLKDIYKKLRFESRNCLFSHMNVSGQRDQTCFVKPHDDGSGMRRVIVDFIYFLSGLDNREFVEGLKHGLYELKPISKEHL